MSPRSVVTPPVPAAAALADRTAVAIGAALRDERRRRQWTLRDVAVRARVAQGTVSGVEAGRRASLETYVRLAVALGMTFDVSIASRRRRPTRPATDLVHAAMAEFAARSLGQHDYHIDIDYPYQHYQFAGRADVLAWTTKPAALLHIENRTRFPDLQETAGSYNAKRHYLATSLARRLGIRRIESETHVMIGLWSAEVLRALRLRRATFRALCPDPAGRLEAWLTGTPPDGGRSSTLVLLDPVAGGRQANTIDLERAIGGARPRFRDYADAARKLTHGRHA
jgi:transcriptional regulator with XRE-family HTH domain